MAMLIFKKVRAKMGWNHYQLAKALETSVTQAVKLESVERPHPKFLKRLKLAAKLSPAEWSKLWDEEPFDDVTHRTDGVRKR